MMRKKGDWVWRIDSTPRWGHRYIFERHGGKEVTAYGPWRVKRATAEADLERVRELCGGVGTIVDG